MARPSGVAFLLSQLGAHTSVRFASRLEALDLTPAHVGVLRIVGQNPGLSQQALSERIGAVPSRVVQLVDELEARGLIERRRSQSDRRNYELHVVSDAQPRLDEIRAAVGEHDTEITKGLTRAERDTLVELLGKIAEAQGLHPDAHPGFGGPPRRTRS